MIQILKKLFKDNPATSKIVLKDKCSDCGRDTAIEIAPTSGGFGLQGGMLIKRPNDGYLTRCPACYEANPTLDDHQNS